MRLKPSEEPISDLMAPKEDRAGCLKAPVSMVASNNQGWHARHAHSRKRTIHGPHCRAAMGTNTARALFGQLSAATHSRSPEHGADHVPRSAPGVAS